MKHIVFLGSLLYMLTGCGSSSGDSTDVTTTQSFMDGRVLASQCYQCHGTNGISTNSWDSIAGEDNLHSEMFEDDEPIMLKQAEGYSSSEITKIESYLNSISNSSNDEDDD